MTHTTQLGKGGIVPSIDYTIDGTIDPALSFFKQYVRVMRLHHTRQKFCFHVPPERAGLHKQGNTPKTSVFTQRFAGFQMGDLGQLVHLGSTHHCAST
jgi:hypothetical protein